MPQIKYNALVQQIAGEMANRFPEEESTWEAFIPYAKIAVKHMAKCFFEGHNLNCPKKVCDCGPEDQAFYRGLIPDPDKEAGAK